MSFKNIKKDFPILEQKVNGKNLVYLDSAATTQKPKEVINSLNNYYKETNSNIHRGVHTLSQKATEKYEKAREMIANFIDATSSKEIIFVRGATEAVNLVASSYVKPLLMENDEIIISQMEHHANIVPWQMVCEEKKAKLKIIPIDENGELIINKFNELINKKTKFISLNHVSNSLGTINPIKKIIHIAHQKNIKIMIDGAQAVQHLEISMKDIDADFYCFSGHKMYAPTGIGILYGKKELLEQMPPYQGGGDMIKSVTFEKTTYNDIPNRFEAGTPNISGAIALGKAIEYINKIGISNINKHEEDLLNYATSKLKKINKVKIIGEAKEKAAVISFIIEGIHPHDIGTIMDSHGIAIRAGHHCTQPIMDFYNVPATARASFAIYNTKEDVDELVKAIEKCIKVFA
ncbi:MAG: cysteine sulfinate desulfinase [Marine Group III euryarchaeote CG-Epi2]|uniref:cysteine desulfurase n=1 Tax=Marine Group III euryarchaeote CG-Epi2 TaxID=1888996 RepID=A0A1J5TNN9_9ARCH|nr:MAG: cysteine sulfinate desulfinase [Marine Group III euryarchaeote CG-Epi2]